MSATKLLEGVEVACFDLFDTLIEIDTRRLPEVDWQGERIRSTVPLVHDAVLAGRGVAIEALVTALREMWREVRAEMNRPGLPPDARWAEVPARQKFRRVLHKLGPIPAEEVEALADALAHHHHEALVSAAVAVEGAAEVLERVRARDVPTVLVSNWDHADAGPAILEQTHLTDLLDHVVISEAVGLRKPHPRIFELALAPYGAAPTRGLHVGDTAEADARGAGELGMRTVWIDRAGKGWPGDERPRPSLVVDALAELLEHL